jgi:hypothetical protein
LPKGAKVGASGSVRRGGLALALLNANNQFSAQITIGRGDFRSFIEAPANDTYCIVISNNLAAWQRTNDVEIDEVGLVGLDPAQQRVVGLDPAEQRFGLRIAQITPLEVDAWETVLPPAQQIASGLRIAGEPASAQMYSAESVRYRLPKGAVVAAAGTVWQGCIILGLIDERQQWAVTTVIRQGAFRTGVEAPAEGTYRIVIANNLAAGQRTNDVQIDEVGLVGLDPAEQRFVLRIAQITPLQANAWETVFLPTQQDASGLRIAGEPAWPQMYSAE